MKEAIYGLITDEDMECIKEMSGSNYDKVTEARSSMAGAAGGVAGAAGGAAGAAAAK